MKPATLIEAAEVARTALAQLDSRAQTYERHVSTLLGYLSSAASRYPDALSEQARIVCESIAKDVGSAATFTPPRPAAPQRTP